MGERQQMTRLTRALGGVWYSVSHQYSMFTPLALLVVLLVLSAARSPHLYSDSGFAGALAGAAPIILATLALTPIAIAGPAGVDLAIGPLMGFINIVLIIELPRVGITSPLLIFVIAILIGVVFEVFQGAVIAFIRLQPVIVTLSGYLILAGLNLVLLAEPGGTAPAWLNNWVWGKAASHTLSPALYVLVIVFVLWWLLSKTTLFRNIRLMGDDERTAYASGIRLVPTRIMAHVITGVIAGVAAVMYSALIGSADPQSGTTFTLTAVTALVLGGASLGGGRASAFGAALGAIDMWLVSYVLATFQFGKATSYVVQLSTGTILVISLLVGGLLLDVARARRRQGSSAAGGSR
jgi:ribose transport system permease protein